MLNPVDAEKVIRDGAAADRYPDDIHEGVAWWVGACLVLVTQAARIAVAYDGRATSAAFHRRLCRGAMNAQRFACTVHDLHVAERGRAAGRHERPRRSARRPGDHQHREQRREGPHRPVRPRRPGAGRGCGPGPHPAADHRRPRPPRPVNDQARGRIEHYRRHRPEGAEQ
ncbi:hypothetical protein GCM10020000_79310 [Streptomyces olivoverticillatus]